MAQSEDADGEGTFSLFTSIAYIPDASAFDSSSFPSHFPRFSPLESSSSPFILLDRHQARLANAHEAFAERGGTWCSKDGSLPSPEDLEGELWKCVRQYGEEKPQRVRLEVGPDGPRTTSFELVTMPETPQVIVLDDRPTDYSDDPFLRYKTTRREAYEVAQKRAGATLKPSPSSDPSKPFDVLLYNTSSEITETCIANFALGDLTPETGCGLLPGMMRAEKLEKGGLREGKITVEEVKKAAKEGRPMTCFNAVRGTYPVKLRLSGADSTTSH